jgi:acyl carrier protein
MNGARVESTGEAPRGRGLSREAVVTLVRDALAEVLPRKKRATQFALSARLFHDVGLDSMQVLAFTFALEERVGMTLPEAELRRTPIESLQDVVDLIIRVG